MLALLMVFAIQRVPSAERIVVEKPTPEAQFDSAWADNFQTAVAQKQDRGPVRKIELDRVATNEPTPVVTERISPDVPAKVPPVVLTSDEEDRPAARHRRRYAESESNVCTRHHMRKVVTHGGRSWRCRR